MKRLVTSALAIGALLGAAACSDDKQLTSIGDSSAVTSGDDSGANGSVPVVPGLSAECQAIYQAIGGASQAMSGASDTEQAKAVFNALVDAVPDDLKADAAVFADAYGSYLEVLAKYDGDASKAMSDPDVVAALSKLGSPEVTMASDHLSAFMDASCGSGS